MNLRESPTHYGGIGQSFVRAWRAFRDSTQQMAPPEALNKISQKAEEIFYNQDSLDHHWFNRVNRLLWVLTGRGVFLLDAESREPIRRIWETASARIQLNYFPDENPREYAQNAPRDCDLDIEELLLQICGRCQLLEDVYQAANNNSKHLVEQLKRDLRGTSEEERRLHNKLKEFESLQSLYTTNLTLLDKERKKVTAKESILNELVEQTTLLKSRVHKLKDENDSIVTRNTNLLEIIETLEDEIETLKKERKPEAVIIEEVVTLPAITNVEKGKDYELRQLREEVEYLNRERAEVLELNNRLMTLQSLPKSEEEELSKERLERVLEAVQNADKEYKKAQADPVRLSEILYELLDTLKL